MEGDGNCFYRAIAYGLYGDQKKYFEIKNIITDYLLENQANY